MDLRFSQGRVYALRLLDPNVDTREDAQRWRELVTTLDEDGIYNFLEGRWIKPEDTQRMELIKQAKAVADRCDALGKQIPLDHAAIHQAYDELRELTSKVEELSLPSLHT